MFKPRGDRPQWEIVYDRLVSMRVGEVIKDEELFGLLPDSPEGSVRGAFWRAVKQVEDDHRRTLDRVRTVGYRVVEAREHEGLARRQQKKARRRLKSAIRKAHSADRSKLTLEERKRLDAVEDHLNRQAEFIHRLETRVEKTEARTARTEKDTAVLADRIDELKALLKRHGIDDEPADEELPEAA
jgi:chromosome segregation ATPase